MYPLGPCARRKHAVSAPHVASGVLQGELDEVALKPSKVSGTFDISLNGKVVFSRKEAGRFPEAKEVG